MADIRFSTRAQYHRVVKQVKRNEDAIVMTNTASSLRSNNTIQLWDNIRKLFSKSNTPAVSVDNTQDRRGIASLFRDKCAKLYSSVPTRTGDLHYLINNIEKEITSCCFTKKS